MTNIRDTWPFQSPDEAAAHSNEFRSSGRQANARRAIRAKTVGVFPIAERLGRLVFLLRTKRGWSQDQLASETKLTPSFVALLEEGLALAAEITPEVLEALGKTLDVSPQALELVLAVVPTEPADNSNWLARLRGLLQLQPPTGFVAALWGFRAVSPPAEALYGGEKPTTGSVQWVIEGPAGLIILVRAAPSAGVTVELQTPRGPAAGWQVSLAHDSHILVPRPASGGVARFPEVTQLDPARTFLIVERFRST